jgi:hypothetical protein
VDSTADGIGRCDTGGRGDPNEQGEKIPKWMRTAIFWIWRRDFNDEEGIEERRTTDI